METDIKCNFVINVLKCLTMSIAMCVFQLYLVLAAPQIGLFRLLQVPSSERYGDLIQRCGDMAQRGPFDICLGYVGPAIKLLKIKKIHTDTLKTFIQKEKKNCAVNKQIQII